MISKRRKEKVTYNIEKKIKETVPKEIQQKVHDTLCLDSINTRKSKLILI